MDELQAGVELTLGGGQRLSGFGYSHPIQSPSSRGGVADMAIQLPSGGAVS